MRFDGAVDVLDHAVHAALRVHDNADLIGRKPKEMMCLDHLEPLVHKARAVHGDLGAHVPRGMRQRLRSCDLRELIARIAAEGPARACEPDAARLTRVLAQIALVDGRVLAVYRQQRLMRGKRHDQVATHDERLLVGQRQLLAAGEGVVARAQPGSAGQGVDDDIHILKLHQSGNGGCAKTHLGTTG